MECEKSVYMRHGGIETERKSSSGLGMACSRVCVVALTATEGT